MSAIVSWLRAEVFNRPLQFERIGPERHNRRVDAPAVLLFVPFSRIAEGVARYAGKPELDSATGNTAQMARQWSDGELRRDLETQAKTLDIANEVIFTGLRTYQEAMRLLQTNAVQLKKEPPGPTWGKRP